MSLRLCVFMDDRRWRVFSAGPPSLLCEQPLLLVEVRPSFPVIFSRRTVIKAVCSSLFPASGCSSSPLNQRCPLRVISCYYNAILFKNKPTCCNPSFGQHCAMKLFSQLLKPFLQGKFPLLGHSSLILSGRHSRTLY